MQAIRMLAEDKDSELFCMEANSASFLGGKQQKRVTKLVAVAIAACSVLMIRRALFLTLAMGLAEPQGKQELVFDSKVVK